MKRFFAAPDSISDREVTLGEDETRHLRDVLRLKAGDEISVFDGKGSEYLCQVNEVGKKSSHAGIVEEVPPRSPESHFRLTLAAGLLKGEKFDLVVQKAVELGAVCLIPLRSIRCDVKVSDGGKRLERWRRIALEATKQSGRALLMEVSPIMTFADLISQAGETVLFSERSGSPLSEIGRADSLMAIVGPEGGWDDSELESASAAGIPIITLGGRTLRAETAAIAVTALLQNRYGDLN